MIILIDTINNECDTGIRTKYAEQLFDLIKKADKNNIDNIVISKVTALLADRDDSVRYWAAAGLGILGPKAIQSVPALQKALDEIKGSTGSKTSASAIRLALERISKNGLSDQPVKAGTK